MAIIPKGREPASIKKRTDSITDASEYLVLSSDKKTVTGFNPATDKGERVVRIPAGVEAIQDKAFLYHRFDHLYVPKELKAFGKYTFQNAYEEPVRIKFIEVEKGNPYFYTDEAALYRKDGSKNILMYVFDHSLSLYTFPEGVSSVDPGAFAYCENLSNIVLSESMETFDEKALPYGTKIRNIHIPASLKHLIVRPSITCDSWDGCSNRIHYTIDENNESLFRDEDSIYEVLEDGSLKLVINMYLGKGRALIREDTTEIGEQAFFAHKNLLEIEFPKSVRCIHSEAFSNCENLRKVILPSSVSFVADDAFSNCYCLDSIKADSMGNQLSESANTKAELWESEQTTEVSVSNITPRQDHFAQFINVFTSAIEELSLFEVAYKDGAVFDKEKKSVSITVPISQYTHNEALLNEYIACAETIQPGNSLCVQVGRYSWDLYSQSGKALGYIDTGSWNITNYLNILTIQNCTVAEVTPKSARRKNAKYALVSITLEIGERTPVEPLTQEDAEMHKMFTYYVDQTGVQLVHWLGNPIEEKIIIPTKIEGLPVTTICSDFFDNICVTEIVFPEGIKRLGASVLHLKKLEKVIFPASLEYISPNVFASWNGDFKDLYLSANTIFVAPIDSYADRFLKAYSPEYFDVSILTIVNDTFKAKPIDTKLHPHELSKASMERHETFLDEITKGGWK